MEHSRADCSTRSLTRYNAPGALRNRLRAAAGLLGAMAVAMVAGGCSLSMHLASLQNDPETTASVTRSPSPLDPLLDDEDWRRAQAALSLAVDPQGSGQPVNWDNPSTKRKGTFAPAGNLVLVENTVCRAFTASITQSGLALAREIRHTGQACRTGPGDWAMRSAQPVSKDPASKDPLSKYPVPKDHAAVVGAANKGETTAQIRPGGQPPATSHDQALPLPTTSILETNENRL